jgi:hypothetical protein
MPVWLRELLTEADNRTPDFLRIIAVGGVLVFLGLALKNWASFDPMAFGTGFAAVLVAAGAAVRINEGPRPGAPVAGPTTVVTGGKTTVENP